MSHEQERIAVLETKVENLEGWMKTIDSRLRSVEKQIWTGVGILVAVQLAIQFFTK